MSHTEIILYRPILHSIAYRLVGCATVAEDIVQDTFLNWLKIDQEKIVNVQAYLTKSVTNLCLNHLESFKQKREEFIDSINPSIPFLKLNTDFSNLDVKQEVNFALAQMLKKLAPSERAVFMLKGIFNFDYSDLTEVLDKKAENCRQLYCRAQKRLAEEKVRFNTDASRIRELVEEFKKATMGEFSELIDGLKKDISAEQR